MEIVGAIIIAIIITLLFVFAFSARGPWGTAWSFFLVILLVVWASSLWIIPVGPVYWGVAWIPLFFIGILFALLLAAIPTSDSEVRGRTRTDVNRDVTRPTREEATAANALSVVFWIFIGLMILAIFIGYINNTAIYTS